LSHIFSFDPAVFVNLYLANIRNASPQVTSIENYMRLCTSQETAPWFGRTTVTAIVLLIWFIGCVASALQYVYEVSFDYCNRKGKNKRLQPFETGKPHIVGTSQSVYRSFRHLEMPSNAIHGNNKNVN